MLALDVFRRNARLGALLALLCLCVQWIAAEMSAFHMAQRLARADTSIEICTAAGIVRIRLADQETPQDPQAPAGVQHCPFCASAAASPPLLAAALSFFIAAEPGAGFVAATPAGMPPAGPDQRHAPKHGPPLLSA
ncbi:DUF2946 family protein [Rhodocyclus purpureus]|uniref:DUF2946 family protein n=1 Tax=Rhodocyclus purpureus TaxID=1067 RepID=UPI001912C7E3|nr:DUF2946 family protein [Rhodocyclus purpureus]MBK5914696.1 hypothetical protein [Rhodocyclus purpureus]